jgi:putative flippase GtrA
MQRIIDFKNNNPKEFARFGKFLVVGLIGFVIDFGTSNVLKRFGVQAEVAQAISFSVATLSNFAFNYFWIYPEAKNANVAKKIGQFLIVSVVGLLIRTPIFSLVYFLDQPVVNGLSLNHFPIDLAFNVALATAVVVLLFWNFFVNRFWTYRDVATK